MLQLLKKYMLQSSSYKPMDNLSKLKTLIQIKSRRKTTVLKKKKIKGLTANLPTQ